MKGTVSEGVLPGLLRDVYIGRKTGCLHFTRGERRVSVVFKGGCIARAQTNIPEERLGETLVKQGLLTEVDLAHATDLVAREHKRLGAALQELGVMDKERLENALAAHVREMLLKLFAWTEGTYAFEEQAVDDADGLALKLSTAEMILEAVRRVEDPDVVRYALGNIDRILGSSTDALLRFQKVALTPADGYVLSRVDGTLSVRELIQLMPMAAEEVQRILFRLLCAGYLEYLSLPPKAPQPSARQTPLQRPAPAAPPPLNPAVEARRREIEEAFEGLKTKNHFEILGIPKASSEAQVKDAYFRLAKRFHPDTRLEPALSGLEDKLEKVFIRLGEAYEVLRNPRSRSSYESDLASRAPRPVIPTPSPSEPAPEDPIEIARVAGDLIRTAEQNVAHEKYWDAIMLLEKAVPLVQGKLKQKAQVLLARSYIKNPHWVKQGEEVLQAVVNDDPENVEAYYLLGTIYKGGGLKTRAISMFRKVLELQPNHEQALVEVGTPPQQATEKDREGGGLLKRLFGKT